jgi:hypothetical protein
MPPFESQPAAGTTDAVADHVNVHVDPHGELIAFRVAKVHFPGLPTQRGGRNQILQPASCHICKGSPRLRLFLAKQSRRWPELYDGFAPDFRVTKLLRKG